MRKEILFSYHNERCHAIIVEELSIEASDRNYIGEVDGYEIYKTYGVHFDQFGFEAIAK